MKTPFALFGAALLALGLTMTQAFAADTEVALEGFVSALLPYVTEIAAALAAGLIGWVTVLLKRKIGLEIDAQHRDALHSALLSGLNLAISTGAAKASAGKIDVGNEAVAVAVRYVLGSVPDAVRYFGLTPEAVGEMVRSKLPAVVEPASAAGKAK